MPTPPHRGGEATVRHSLPRQLCLELQFSFVDFHRLSRFVFVIWGKNNLPELFTEESGRNSDTNYAERLRGKVGAIYGAAYGAAGVAFFVAVTAGADAV
jgi:hypothetical protein